MTVLQNIIGICSPDSTSFAFCKSNALQFVSITNNNVLKNINNCYLYPIDLLLCGGSVRCYYLLQSHKECYLNPGPGSRAHNQSDTPTPAICNLSTHCAPSPAALTADQAIALQQFRNMDYGNRNVHITLSLYPNVSNISSNAKIADIQVHKNG